MYSMIICKDKYNKLLSAEPSSKTDGVSPKTGETYWLQGKNYEVLLVSEDNNAKVLTLTLNPLN